MIDIWAQEVRCHWFGLAYVENEIVATVVGSSRDEALRWLARCLPLGAKYQLAEDGSDFARKTMLMLGELEAGNEDSKCFTLAGEYVPEPLSKVLTAAAAIPKGYVTSYGNIAKASDTDSRNVGRIMASNPLYPIVPCHRVVGVDLSLVGYRGSRDISALHAKLARLEKEVLARTKEMEVPVNATMLLVYPVEWAIRKAGKRDSDPTHQLVLLRK